MPLILKDYIKHAENCGKYSDIGYVELRYSFVPNKSMKISIEEKFYQKRIKIGRCKDSHILINS